MANTSKFGKLKRLGVLGSGIIVLGLILFVFLFFLEYTYSNKRGNIFGSILYTFPFYCALTASFLLFVMGSAERRQTQIPWHRQKSILNGLLFLSISLISLVQLINSLMNNGLPDAVALPIAGVALVLILIVSVRLTMILSSKAGAEQ